VRSAGRVTMSWVCLKVINLIVASTVKAAHDIYVWERAMGSLIKILEGPKEELIDVDVSFISEASDCLVASFTTTGHCGWLGQWNHLSMEHYSHGRVECFCS
jgi:hypothetical protein